MDIFVINLLLGISFGFILFLLGTGLSLTMGLMRIVNLAHGALYMVGGYAGLTVARLTGNFVAGILAGGICAGVLGIIMETGFLRRLYKRELAQVLLTIGFIYVLTNLAQWVWGTVPTSGVVPSILSGSMPVAGIRLPVFRMMLIAFGLVAAVVLWLFQEKTKFGAIIRAGMDNKEVTMGLGINLKIVFTGVFALGTFIAGFCGLIGAPLLGINLSAGWDTLLLAMIVVIVGGTGSIQGALAGGLIIGLVVTFGKAYFPAMANFTMYLVLIIILLFRPSGLLGRAMEGMQQTTQALREGLEVTTANANLAASQGKTRRTWLFSYGPYIIIGLALLLLGLPDVLPSYFLSMLTKILIFAIFAISLDIVVGYTGLLSLGHAAFLGVGGYTVAILMLHYGIYSFWAVMPLSIIMTGIFAAIIGYLVLRVSGVYFLLVTLGFGQLLYVTAVNWRSVTGGTDGLIGVLYPALGIPGINLTSSNIYFLVFIAFVICYFLLSLITNSPFGRALIGIRENEPRMQALGYNTWAHKYVAFIIGGVFAGVAGMLYAFLYGTVVPSLLDVTTSTTAMLMVIIGGAGTLFGPFIGSVLIILLQNFTSLYAPERWPLILGAIFIICVLFIRGGFALYFSRFWRRVRLQYRSTKT